MKIAELLEERYAGSKPVRPIASNTWEKNPMCSRRTWSRCPVVATRHFIMMHIPETGRVGFVDGWSQNEGDEEYPEWNIFRSPGHSGSNRGRNAEAEKDD